MASSPQSEEERLALLGRFLAEHRRRIAPHATVLGDRPRRRRAVGKLVTRHEIADASGVTRRWYEFAELGVPTRASASILLNVADVLGLDDDDRETLLRLAIPPVDYSTPRGESIEILEAFSSVRWYLRKLQSCSTIDELLTLLEDTAAAQFPEVSYLMTAFRWPLGGWCLHGEGIGTPARTREFVRLQELLGPAAAENPAACDEIVRFPIGSMPGDILTYRNYNAAVAAPILELAPVEFERLFEPVLVAVTRSRSGYVAHLMLSDFHAVYGETERALAATIADFASLALSS
jgi:transcriptional regulator with XRE-family HTH domain